MHLYKIFQRTCLNLIGIVFHKKRTVSSTHRCTATPEASLEKETPAEKRYIMRIINHYAKFILHLFE